MIVADRRIGKAGCGTLSPEISTLPVPPLTIRTILSRDGRVESFRLGTDGTQAVVAEPLRDNRPDVLGSDGQRWNWQGEITPEIEAALTATAPVSLMRWQEKLLALVWRLKAMPELEASRGLDLLPLADLWAERAADAFHRLGVSCPVGMTLAAVRKAFQRAWMEAKYYVGNRPIDALAQLAKGTPIPEGGAERREFYWLVSLCERLQRMADHLEKPGFPLGQNIAADLLGVSRPTAKRYLKRLEREGLLTLLKRGSRTTGLATEYRWSFTEPAAKAA
jgi:hypothetical protein